MFRTRKSDDAAQEPQGSPEDLLVIVDRVVNPYLVMFHDPAGYRAEQVRALRNKLIAMNPDGAAKTLVVTSAIQGEGKTVTAINLALAFAELERAEVLLVDADLRSPSVEKYLQLNPAPGLSDLLLGRIGLEQAVRSSGVRKLSILSAGTRLAGPSEVLSAPRIQELCSRLKERYQYVIFDTPSVLPATDASVLAARVDGTLLVVRLEHSSKQLSKDAVRTLQGLGANVLGVFVTEVRGADPEADPRLGYRPEEG